MSGQLGSTLTVVGNVSVSSGGAITPGETVLNTKTGTAGLITISGGTLTLTSGTNLYFDLAQTNTAGTTYDQIAAGGAVTWAGRRST